MKLFIDTNWYLRFYDSKKTETKKLLEVLQEVNEYIIMPLQIVNEIQRNKTKVFLDAMATIDKQLVFSKLSVPDHLEGGERIIGWNTMRSEIEISLKASLSSFKKIKEDIARKIANGEDIVSKAFEDIFNNKIEESPDEFNKSRIRKGRGNPPGKKSDPIGDELCWEQILTIAKDAKEIWIITKDADYYIEIGDKICLNPLLYDELKKVQPEIVVKIFKSLYDGLDQFSKRVEKSKKIAIDENKIRQEENAPLTGTTYVNEFELMIFDPCESCGEVSEASPCIVKDVKRGEVLMYSCTNCGGSFENC